MNPSEEFAIRVRKAVEYFEGARELGLSRRQMCSELRRVLDDDDLIERLYAEDMKEMSDEPNWINRMGISLCFAYGSYLDCCKLYNNFLVM